MNAKAGVQSALADRSDRKAQTSDLAIQKQSQALLLLHCDSKTTKTILHLLKFRLNNDFIQINPYSQN
jgi:hypothetical protein